MLNILNSLSRQPLVRYALLLYFAGLILFFALRFEKNKFANTLPRKGVAKSVEIITALLYVVLTLILLYNGSIVLFPYLNAIFLGVVLLLLVKIHDYNGFLSTLLLTLIPYTVVVLFNSYPLGDDARFTVGFAVAIARDGRWIPYRYFENDYYQLFHAEPALSGILASATGLSLEDVNEIPIYYLTLKYTLYLLYTLGIYLLTYKLTKSRKTALISLILFSITPPLSLAQIVTQGFSIALALIASSLILDSTPGDKSALYLTTTILTLAGIVFHVTYLLLISTLLIPLLFVKKFINRNNVESTLTLTLVVGLIYLTFTYAANAVFRGAVGGLEDLMRFLSGAIAPFSISPTWYSANPYTIFYVSWALLPSLAASALTYELPKLLISKNKGSTLSTSVFLSSVGLAGTTLNYLLRQATWLGGRYFYWLYLLLLPFVADYLATGFRDKLVATLFLVTIVAWAGVYGVQDFTHSANTFVLGIGWADNNTWEFSQVLSRLLPQGISVVTDQRVGVALGAMQFQENLTLSPVKQGVPPDLLVVRNDSVGYAYLLWIESMMGFSSLLDSVRGTVLIYEGYNVYYYTV
jgi:hypothetical protein